MTYEYKCKKCNHEWEEEASIKSLPTEICPLCKEKKAYRLISGGGFVLNGSGWFNKGGY